MIELTDNSVNSCYKYTPQAQGCKGIYGHTQKSIRKYKKRSNRTSEIQTKIYKIKISQVKDLLYNICSRVRGPTHVQ